MSDDLEVAVALKRLDDKLERQHRKLIDIEQRLTSLLELAQKSAETSTRLKLMADMAKDAGVAHAEAIEKLTEAIGLRSAD